ncbi:MAG: thioesterase [Dokdonella sp.]|nr:MAG: thioesterase [Dokdonella sp.]
MNGSPRMPTAAAALERELLAQIPLARAMALRVVAHAGESLTLAAPLAPNINDKGCAFGGSLASLMTLAGWGVLRLAVAERDLDCDIYVQDSTIRYLAPVWGELRCEARPATGESCAAFLDTLAARGKARLRVDCTVALPDGGEAATLSARFVALRTDAAAA